MKNYNLKMLVLSLLTTLAISGCSVHTREYNRRPSRYDRHHNDHHDHGRRGYDRHYNHY